MTNKTNFYKITEIKQNDKGWLLCFSLFPEHSIFKGHFPGQPVLPGVCMILIVKNAVNSLTGKKWQLSESGQIKFLEMIIPNQEEVYNFQLEIEEQETHCQTKATFEKEGKPFFKFQGKFTKLPITAADR